MIDTGSGTMKVWAGLLLVLATMSPARAYDDPKALVDAIYAPYTTLGVAQDQDPAQFYSERLKGLVAANAAAAGDNPAPVLDFNPFIGAKQALLRDLAVGTPVGNTEQAIVTVSFGNFGDVSLLSLALVKEADGWKVDDIASLGEGENWLLSWLLQYDPFAIR